MTQTIKRFYKTVSIAQTDNGRYEILLDGRPVKTPAKNRLTLENEALAQAIAAEWDAQSEHISADAMPLTRIHAIAIDRLPNPTERSAILEDLLRYLETDMLCYRAAEGSALHARQALLFTPVLKQFNARYHVTLATTSGIMPVSQPGAAFRAAKAELSALSTEKFAAIALATPLLGSLALALLMLHQDISAETAWECARLDETHAAEHYGQDPDLEAKLADKQRDIHATAQVFAAGR